MVLVGLGLVPGLGMVGVLSIFGPPLLRTQPTMMTTTTMLRGVFGGGYYPMPLGNCRYLNPNHPQVQISTSGMTPMLHGTKVGCVPTHQLNVMLQAKCGDPQGKCVCLHLNTCSGVTKIAFTYALIHMKVHMRAWSETRILICRRTRTIIVHCGILLN